jgi:hypothetical protein
LLTLSAGLGTIAAASARALRNVQSRDDAAVGKDLAKNLQNRGKPVRKIAEPDAAAAAAFFL